MKCFLNLVIKLEILSKVKQGQASVWPMVGHMKTPLSKQDIGLWCDVASTWVDYHIIQYDMVACLLLGLISWTLTVHV